MTSHRFVRSTFNRIRQERGIMPHELQISKSTIAYLKEFVDGEVDKILNLAVDEVIAYNEKHNYKPKKRVTTLVIQNTLKNNLPSELVKTIRLGQQNLTE